MAWAGDGQLLRLDGGRRLIDKASAWVDHFTVAGPTSTARTLKYRVLRVVLWPGNRFLRWQLRHGRGPRAFALLETTGRRTGAPRVTCVGNGLIDDTFWVIAAHGTQADWIRNLSANPRVRVLTDRVWRTGTAVALPHDDPAERSLTLPVQWDAAIGRRMATTPLTIRIDLDPPKSASAGSRRRR